MSADDRLGAGRGAVGLAVAEPADVDVEEVDLGVGGDPVAVAVEGDRDVPDPVAVAAIAMEPPIRLMRCSRAQSAIASTVGPASSRSASGAAGAVDPGVPLLGQEARRRRRARRPRPRAAPCRAMFSALSARAANWTQAARIVSRRKPTPAASSSSTAAAKAIEQATNRMAACSIAIAIAPICWSSSGESAPQLRRVLVEGVDGDWVSASTSDTGAAAKKATEEVGEPGRRPHPAGREHRPPEHEPGERGRAGARCRAPSGGRARSRRTRGRAAPYQAASQKQSATTGLASRPGPAACRSAAANIGRREAEHEQRRRPVGEDHVLEQVEAEHRGQREVLERREQRDGDQHEPGGERRDAGPRDRRGRGGRACARRRRSRAATIAIASIHSGSATNCHGSTAATAQPAELESGAIVRPNPSSCSR